MQANCYFFVQDEKALLIDPGDSADFLLGQIQTMKLELVGMIATHGHFDHSMAVGEIQLTYPQLPLYIHPNDEFLLKRVVKTAKHFLGYDPVAIPIQSMQKMLEGQIRISSANWRIEFRILHTPGHTPGSCCLYFENEKVLFSGDTLFKSGIGRYDFSYSDKGQLKQSVQKLLNLPSEITVYPGHGDETSIEDEKKIIQQYF